MEFKRCYGCMQELEAPGAECPRCGYDNTNGPASQPSHVLPCGAVLNGQYLVGRTLGQGGFGITYIGYDLNLEIPVCIKEYYPEGAAMRSATQSRMVYWGTSENAEHLKQSRKSFVKEAQKAVKLRDLSHVVSVWGVFYENETAYIVMDYIEGETLKSRLLRTQRTLGERECVELLTPIMEDLEEAHKLGIIHRDIKPDNIMLREDGEPILLDMGAAKDLCKATPDGGSLSSTVVVSEGFSPLEQYSRNGNIGPWTDLYAMCATIYWCVTGKVPSAPNERMMGKEINYSALSGTLRKVLEKGMALKPDDRIQTMRKLQAALCAAVADKARQQKPKLWIAALGAAAALLVVIVLIVKLVDGAGQKETSVPKQTTEPSSVLPASSTAVLSGEPLSSGTIENLTYAVYSDYVQIIGYVRNTSAISIPAEIENKPVTSIREYTFQNCTSLTSITIPDSVESIGDNAFSGCRSLTSITIPSGVKEMHTNPASNCDNLKEFAVSTESLYYKTIDGILFTADEKNLLGFPAGNGVKKYDIPDGVTSIGDSAFSNCAALTSITIPDSVTSIGGRAFQNCTALTSVTIPDSVITIGNDAFTSCVSLTSITIPSGIKEIHSNPAPNCNHLKEFAVATKSLYYKAIDGVLFTADGKELLGFPAGNEISDFIIPEGVTSIGDSAFSGCTELRRITLPKSLTSIGNNAFSDCTRLRDITIPDNVVRLGNNAFKNCNELTHITIPEGVTSIETHTFYNCTSLKDITIPDSVTSIGSEAFYNCTALTSITIPDTVISIGDWALWGCDSLTSIMIPNSVTSIGDGTFCNCDALASITISDNLTSIGSSAFWGCHALINITIPNSVTSIGDKAFLLCNALKVIFYTGTENQWEAIQIGPDNDPLTNATIYYISQA